MRDHGIRENYNDSVSTLLRVAPSFHIRSHYQSRFSVSRGNEDNRAVYSNRVCFCSRYECVRDESEECDQIYW